jgi:glycosyltransferase involved in cell wall biosynthesis
VKEVLNHADAVIVASKATYKEACKIIKESSKVHLLPNGVDTKRFNPSLDGSYVRRKLGLEERAVVFSLRAHEPKYGLEYLIRAAPMVIRKNKDVVFVIGSDGPLKSFHEWLATKLGVRENMIFTGRLSYSEVPYYYAMSDIVVVPSLQEAFGLVVSEAMACAKPVIGTEVGGIPDQIINGYNGFLVPPRKPEQIAEKILWLLDHPQESRQMGINGRKVVEEKFCIDRRIKQLIALYEDLLR